MPRKKKTPVVTLAIDLPKEFLEKLIPGPMDAAGDQLLKQLVGGDGVRLRRSCYGGLGGVQRRGVCWRA
jgi:hypothetical protein